MDLSELVLLRIVLASFLSERLAQFQQLFWPLTTRRAQVVVGREVAISEYLYTCRLGREGRRISADFQVCPRFICPRVDAPTTRRAAPKKWAASFFPRVSIAAKLL
jgi:hypothetical protein